MIDRQVIMCLYKWYRFLKSKQNFIDKVYLSICYVRFLWQWYFKNFSLILFTYTCLLGWTHYRWGTVNSNTVNSKFHLIRSYCEIFVYNFPNISCLKYTVNSNFHLIRGKTLPTNDFELTVPDLYHLKSMKTFQSMWVSAKGVSLNVLYKVLPKVLICWDKIGQTDETDVNKDAQIPVNK